MSDTARATALVLSVLLWSPVAPRLLRGEVAPERALLLYLGAWLLAMAGCALLCSLVRAYAPAPADEASPAADDADRHQAVVGASVPEQATPGRRASDVEASAGALP
jgi:hypothetical protein